MEQPGWWCVALMWVLVQGVGVSGPETGWVWVWTTTTSSVSLGTEEEECGGIPFTLREGIGLNKG